MGKMDGTNRNKDSRQKAIKTPTKVPKNRSLAFPKPKNVLKGPATTSVEKRIQMDSFQSLMA
jgi:hypothetical protein